MLGLEWPDLLGLDIGGVFPLTSALLRWILFLSSPPQEYLNLADETLHLAVHLMNSYMRASHVRIPHLQLLSATCLFLACKLEEHTRPEVRV